MLIRSNLEFEKGTKIDCNTTKENCIPITKGNNGPIIGCVVDLIQKEKELVIVGRINNKDTEDSIIKGGTCFSCGSYQK